MKACSCSFKGSRRAGWAGAVGARPSSPWGPPSCPQASTIPAHCPGSSAREGVGASCTSAPAGIPCPKPKAHCKRERKTLRAAGPSPCPHTHIHPHPHTHCTLPARLNPRSPSGSRGPASQRARLFRWWHTLRGGTARAPRSGSPTAPVAAMRVACQGAAEGRPFVCKPTGLSLACVPRSRTSAWASLKRLGFWMPSSTLRSSGSVDCRSMHFSSDTHSTSQS